VTYEKIFILLTVVNGAFSWM